MSQPISEANHREELSALQGRIAELERELAEAYAKSLRIATRDSPHSAEQACPRLPPYGPSQSLEEPAIGSFHSPAHFLQVSVEGVPTMSLACRRRW